MPVYCFRYCSDDKPFERTLTVAELEAHQCGSQFLFNGRKAYQDFRAQHCATQLSSCWPQESQTMGVHKEELEDRRKIDRKAGLRTTYRRCGDSALPVFSSRAERKRYCEAHGFGDPNAGYGDAVPPSKKRSR